MRKILLVLFGIFALMGTEYAQSKAISPYLIGQNAWYPSTIDGVQEEIADAGFQLIRIGGNGYERSDFITTDAVDLIDYVRSVGAEPLLQMPRQAASNDLAYDAIAYINGTMGRNVKFWSIGNEPDHPNQPASAEEVYAYFKAISEDLKRYDSTIKVFGLDHSYYQYGLLDRYIGGDLDLTGKIPGEDYYYLDVVSFHGYRHADINSMESKVDNLLGRIQTVNESRPDQYKMAWAITEFNTHWKVDLNDDEGYLPYTFHNGQVFALLYDLGMRKGALTIAPWSILEGGADREGTDLSLFDKVDDHYFPRSNYHHSMMVAQNMRTNYLESSDTIENVIVSAMGDESGFSVMLLNTGETDGYDYTLRLDGQYGAETELQIMIDGGTDSEITGSLEAHSTQMLLFNINGLLTDRYTYTAINADTMESPSHETFFQPETVRRTPYLNPLFLPPLFFNRKGGKSGAMFQDEIRE